ncbi:protein patched [Chelonus insularis]|uniref:protein patched n=1 Tax=Chelonus insularis TaxID=460826 RepID=UPI00158AEAEB|nr:protein patched [Chelonus insularis]XP_034941244.1 protein patched [Chelonus insularis]XP_034941245.1 protein patched [Chelonus insularis]
MVVAASDPSSGILAGRPTTHHGSISRRAHQPPPSSQHIRNDQKARPVKCPDQQQHPRHSSNIYVRPSWTDASIALDQVEKGKAGGQRSAIWIRAWLQDEFSQLGDFLHRHAGKVIFVAILALATFCVALKSVQIHSKVEQLWIQEGGVLEKELAYTSETLGEITTTTHQMFIQTPKRSDANILQVSALKEHLDILKAATRVTVDLYDTPWELKDLCYALSVPSFDNQFIERIFDKIVPCNIITPLDCFWEGSKIVGSDHSVHISHIKNHEYVQWMDLNPMKLFEEMKGLVVSFPFQPLEEYMKRSGITNGYQSKPCLDPMDPNCPNSAPNKKTQQVPDIGAELTGGCYGFAAKYMHWPEELIVGGAKHNKTGHIIQAAALQSVVQLMTARELYEYHSHSYKVHHIDWSQEKASQILDKWQRAFNKQVKRKQLELNMSGTPVLYNSYAFSTTTMNDILSKYSEISITNMAIGCGLVILYTGFALFRWKDPVHSQASVGVAGVILICATVAAGLGFCALLRIPFNAITTQMVPFLALGLGIHDIFLLTHTYATTTIEACVLTGSSEQTKPLSHFSDTELQTNIILKRTGLSVLLKGLSNVAAFFAAAIIPIPALRVFAFQSSILILFNLAALLLVFPAMISLDIRRRRSGRSDIFCCCLPAITNDKYYNYMDAQSKNSNQNVIKTIPLDQKETLTNILTDQNELWTEENTNSNNVNVDTNYNANNKKKHERRKKRNEKEGDDEVDADDDEDYEHGKKCPEEANRQRDREYSSRQAPTQHKKNYHQQHRLQQHEYTETDTLTGFTPDECLQFSLTQLAAKHYAPFITKPSTKVLGMMLLAVVIGGSVWQAMKIDNGLELSDLVPQNSDEHAFLVAQSKYFGFYNMYAVTGRDFEYPNNQKLLYEYHDAFMRIKNVIKNDDGGLPKFWLSIFRDWLRDLQAAFDRDYKNGCINQEGWYKNASDEAILAYKLLVQTGHVDNPIDKTLISQVRLVDSEGIINPRAFYNYLSAWTSNDASAYGASEANLKPEPRQWTFSNDHELQIPKSMPLIYAQMPFYLHKLTDTNQITELITSVRKLCKKFEERGLPNFPSGIPFLFWDQYMDLRSCLFIALTAALGATVAIIGILLLNVWAAILIGTSLAGVVLQLLGVMALFGMKLSAVTVVLLVISVGITVHFTADICLSFVTCVGGSRDRRIRLAIEHMFSPVVHGAIGILLTIAMLAFSDFEFIVRSFFYALLCLIGIGFINGLLFFPVLLSLVGPSSEVIPPHEHPDRISTPTPPASPQEFAKRRHFRQQPPEPPRRPHKMDNNCGRLHTEPSLTTITEEPNSWHSTTQESCIIVQPEVKVETTSTCGNQNCGAGSETNRTSPVLSNSHITTTTKVTATANIKVQVHTPLNGSSKRSSRSSSTTTTNSNEEFNSSRCN